MLTVRFRIPDSQVKRVQDPHDNDRKSFSALVPALSLPDNLPLNVNPRDQKLSTDVARDIRSGLLSSPKLFHLYNRGLTIIADDANYDNQTHELILIFKNPNEADENATEDDDVNGTEYDLDTYVKGGFHGIVDGGHTYRVILDAITKKDDPSYAGIVDAFVKLEVLTGIDDTNLIINLARARNRSTKVEESALANLSGHFDWLKEELRDRPYADKIRYKQFGPEPIDVREVIQILFAFHPDYLREDKSPVQAYTGRATPIKQFEHDMKVFEKMAEGEKRPVGFLQLKHIAAEILEFYGHLVAEFADCYSEVGGYSHLEGDIEPNAKVDAKNKGKIKSNTPTFKKTDKRYPVPFVAKVTSHLPEKGLIMPLFSGFRALVKIDPSSGYAQWHGDPVKLFEENKLKYARMVLRESLSRDKNPNSVGKNSNFWEQLYDKIQTDHYRSEMKDVKPELQLD